MVERALLVAIHTDRGAAEESRELLDELAQLTRTLGVGVAESVTAFAPRPQPRLFCGKGKAAEIVERAKSLACDVIIFDNELTPAQQRNWERLSELCVIDRQEVILDIFAQRAQTREARLQVELARAQYSLPRLTRAWSHLDRQAGAIGVRGEGEKQIELDRRMVRAHIRRLEREIEKVRAQRTTQRKQRQRVPYPVAAIVGYTNAGKSSLLNRLTGAGVLVEDQLFATLDTTTRRIELPDGQPLMLIDTVGFIRNLPHQLVDAFKATLEETLMADILVHLVDASHLRCVEFFNTTRQVLEELGAQEKQQLLVFNKIDQLKNTHELAVLRRHFPEAHFISAATGEGIDGLEKALQRRVSHRISHVRLQIPHSRSDLISLLHRQNAVESIAYDAEGAAVSAALDLKTRDAVRDYIVPADRKAASPSSQRSPVPFK